MNHSCYKKILLLVLFIAFYTLYAHTEWTTTYHFDRASFRNYQGTVVVEKVTKDPFSQLLVSWNAAMPKRGYLRFFLERYDEKNKKWSSFKMYEWGPHVSRSFFTNDKATGERYAYVRFEGARGQLYKKFRVRVQGIDGADSSSVRHIAVCVAHLPLFTSELSSFKGMRPKKIYIRGVPSVSQHDERYPESSGWCSPASLKQVIEYYNYTTIDLALFAQSVFDTGLGIHGSWPFNTAQAGVLLPGHTCYVSYMRSVKDLIGFLTQGYPVIVSICSAKILPGAPKAYDKGHLLTVIGIDLSQQKIICHDTAEKNVEDVLKYYPIIDFIQMWENRHRLAYVIVPHHYIV